MPCGNGLGSDTAEVEYMRKEKTIWKGWVFHGANRSVPSHARSGREKEKGLSGNGETLVGEPRVPGVLSGIFDCPVLFPSLSDF